MVNTVKLKLIFIPEKELVNKNFKPGGLISLSYYTFLFSF